MKSCICSFTNGSPIERCIGLNMSCGLSGACLPNIHVDARLQTSHSKENPTGRQHHWVGSAAANGKKAGEKGQVSNRDQIQEPCGEDMLERQPQIEVYTDPWAINILLKIALPLSSECKMVMDYCQDISSLCLAICQCSFYWGPLFNFRTYTPRFAKALLQMLPSMESEPHTWDKAVAWLVISKYLLRQCENNRP